MSQLRFAAIGAGFWARFQLAGWHEHEGVRCVAIYNRNRSKAETLAAEFSIPMVYSDPVDMLEREQVDFVDVITAPETHAAMVRLAARFGRNVVCQKPLAMSLAEAEEMLNVCRSAGVSLFVNENWRWQRPIREFAAVLRSGVVGQPFRARIDMISGFPVFANQPFLRELEQFVITDMGSHTLDTARYLFGEATSVYCQTQKVHTDIQGEDAATIHLKMANGMAVVVEMAYAENYLERDRFPETAIFVEAEKGSVELQLDHMLRVTTADGTHVRRVPPPRYPWADPAYDVIHSSIVACHGNLVDAMRGDAPAETTGEDNLETVRLVFASYESAATNQVVTIQR